MSVALRSTTRPTSPTYAIWKAADKIDRSGLANLLTPTETTVLHALIRRMDPTNWSTWVGVETLAVYVGGGRSSIQKALRGLEAKGLIHTAARVGCSSVTRLTPDMIAWVEGPINEAPTRPDSGPPSKPTRPESGPKQSKPIQNRVEQQTEPPPAVVAPSIDLPEDLARFAESDRTIGRATVAKLIERHGEERVRQAVEFIRAQYDSRGIRVLNRGGLLRTAAEQSFQTPEQVQVQEKVEKAVAIEQHRPGPDATWGRSPSGRVLTVIEVRPDAVKLVDEKGRESMLPNWAMKGWSWGQ